MFKILQARLQQYVNREISNIKAGFRKGRGTRGQIANIHWVTEKKQGNSRKTSTSALLTRLKPLTVWITTNCRKERDGNTRPPYLKKLYAGQEGTVRTRHGTTDWLKIGKGVPQG